MPHQLDGEREAAIVQMRLAHPRYGPQRIAYYLQQRGVTPPSLMTIHRVLARHGLSSPQARRKVLPKFKRWERGRSMELWQMDIVGGVLTSDGTEAKILTGIDDHSRFMVCAGIMTRATGRAVCTHFAAALERHGAPEEILTDNGKVFTNRFGLTPTEVLFDRICRENGVAHRLTAPASPTTTGKIERFHRTLRDEFLTPRTFATLASAQEELDEWITHYNTERPHRSLDMAVPADRFYERRPVPEGPPPDLSSMLEDRTGDDWISRTVSINGVISVSYQVFSVGKQRSGHVVDVHVLPSILQVYDGAELIKAVARTTKGEVRKKRAEPHRARLH